MAVGSCYQAEICPGVIVDLIFAREDLVAAHDPRVGQLIGGWRKAVHLVHTQPDIAYPIMANAFGLPLDQFRATVSGIRWLELEDNKRLYGTIQQPGPMISAFKEVSNVLRKNRPEVYEAAASDYLVRSYVETER